MTTNNQPLIKLSRAFVGREELAQIETVLLETVNFGLGKHVQEFEERVKSFLNTAHDVIAVNTGTSALHAALFALKAAPGSEIIVPSITFVASYSAISAAGLTPVSCDVVTPSGHIDPEDASRRITNRTVAIMPVCYAGRDFDRKAIYDLAMRHDLRVIEDDAHAFGSKTAGGASIGSTGDIICFSFDGIKNITCGEGGAVVTKDPEIARRVRVLRSLGIEKDVELRYKGQRAWDYNVTSQGYRYHMSNINAAMGVAQLDRFPDMYTRKQALWQHYERGRIDYGLEEFLQPTQAFDAACCLHIYSCLLPEGVCREDLRQWLLSFGIESGFHYAPNHLHTMYASHYRLPIAENLGRRLLSLPFHPAVNQNNVDHILSSVAAYRRR